MTPNNLEFRVATLEKIFAVSFPKATKRNQVAMVELVQNIVCDEFNIRRELLLSESRIASVVWPRHICMALGVEFSGMSSNAIASLFNRLDHSTVLHALKRVRHEEQMKKAAATQIALIRQRVESAIALWK